MNARSIKRKHSRRRDAIAAAICDSREHPSAEAVYRSLKPRFPSLSLGTVYRNISMLREEGVIKSVGAVSGEERFDGDLSDHPHFVCERCGAVMDISEDFSPRLSAAEEVASRYGVAVTRRALVYYGVCAVCGGISGDAAPGGG
ncbi:MAG: transcriptional repressor [Oscillospiraceae bacterium]|jgi:Fur family peroxide stress response transcriptional regulator|nr:transcriptional repressor [Oscillospiraceae bacterium]